MVEHLPNDLDPNAIFPSLAHPIRLATQEQRAEDPRNVKDLVQPRDVFQPTVSKHLQVLIDADLLDNAKDDWIRLCYLDAAPLRPAFGGLTRYCIFWDGWFESLVDHPENEDQ